MLHRLRGDWQAISQGRPSPSWELGTRVATMPLLKDNKCQGEFGQPGKACNPDPKAPGNQCTCGLTRAEVKEHPRYNSSDGTCPCGHDIGLHPHKPGKHTTTRYPPSLVPHGLCPSLPGARVRWWPFLPGSPSAVFPRWRFASHMALAHLFVSVSGASSQDQAGKWSQ